MSYSSPYKVGPVMVDDELHAEIQSEPLLDEAEEVTIEVELLEEKVAEEVEELGEAVRRAKQEAEEQGEWP